MSISTSPSAVIDEGHVEVQRAEQSRRYAHIASGIWVFLSLFLWFRGYRLGAVVCTVQTIVMLILSFAYRNKRGLRDHRQFTNVFLGLSCLAIFFVTVAEPDIWVALFFLPLGVVMASQVLGVRGALPWLGVNIVAVLAYPFTAGAFNSSFQPPGIDSLAIAIGVATGAYMSCVQFEILFRQRTDALVDLSSRFQKLATTDPLTGLMNRRKFQDQLAASLKQAQLDSTHLALLSIDMNGFKEINDTMGHPVGDETLCEIANRLGEVAAFESVFRLGGDEFCVIVSDSATPRRVNELAKAIHDRLCDPYSLNNTTFRLGASIGVAMYPDHATTWQDLLAFADTAMYHAKTNMLGICDYDEKLTKQLLATAHMQNRLASAVEDDEFFVVYQPQVDIRSGSVVGVEALLRWRCDGRVVSPAEFIPLLEKTRLIVPVGRWVMREACRQLRQWTDTGFDVRVAVNISAVQFSDPNFGHSIRATIEESGVDPGKLDFEVTEGALIKNIDEAVERLTELKALGATISIDDFGTGYSSLAYLRQLPLDRLKIDRSFVRGVPDHDDGTIASSVIVLAHALNLKVLAEAVETTAQLDFLARHDCDEYQGFLHSRPVEAVEVTKYLTRDNSARLTRRAHRPSGVTQRA